MGKNNQRNGEKPLWNRNKEKLRIVVEKLSKGSNCVPVIFVAPGSNREPGTTRKGLDKYCGQIYGTNGTAFTLLLYLLVSTSQFWSIKSRAAWLCACHFLWVVAEGLVVETYLKITNSDLVYLKFKFLSAEQIHFIVIMQNSSITVIPEQILKIL